MPAFTFFVIAVVVLLTIVFVTLYFSARKRVHGSHLAMLSILAIVLTFVMYAFMVYENDRRTVMTHWEAQDDYAGLASEMLSGQKKKPDAWFYAKAAEDEASESETLSTNELLARIELLVHTLQTQTHAHADDAEYWKNLSGIYRQLQDVTSARDSLALAYHLAPENTDIAMRYAQVSFVAENGKLTDSSRAALDKVLQRIPHHEGAYMLKGMAAAKEGNLADVQKTIKKLTYILNEKKAASTAQATNRNTSESSAAIARLKQLSHMLTERQNAKARQGGNIVAKVIFPGKATVNSTATLFVTARPKQGTAYAVKAFPVNKLLKQKQSDFPELAVTLSNNDYLLTRRTLSQAKRDRIALFLVAHISQTGNAIAQTGDWVSEPAPVTFDSTPLQLRIDQIKQ